MRDRRRLPRSARSRARSGTTGNGRPPILAPSGHSRGITAPPPRTPQAVVPVGTWDCEPRVRIAPTARGRRAHAAGHRHPRPPRRHPLVAFAPGLAPRRPNEKGRTDYSWGVTRHAGAGGVEGLLDVPPLEAQPEHAGAGRGGDPSTEAEDGTRGTARRRRGRARDGAHRPVVVAHG